MRAFVFGNPDVSMDSLPLRILPRLRKLYPDVEFEAKDPNEEWDVGPISEALTIIDTAVGIKETTVFYDLKRFARPPHLGMHDFDALTNLRYMMKLGKIKNITVVGIPAEMGEDEAIEGIKKAAAGWFPVAV
jgi:hypothetical protein